MSSSRNKKSKNEDRDPTEILRQKFLSKCKFRKCARMAMANAYWLIADVDHYEGLDVKRRVEQAVRVNKARKQMLSIADKALLNKAAADRTDHEKKYLFRLLGGLKCFKRYPTKVKRKLAALLYFTYYGPGRVVVRENQEAHALYFIVTGEIIVSHMIWDDLDQRNVSVNVGVMRSGDMFGEISLLHHIPRTATCVTNDHCEMLALMKEDFENVLQVCVQKQWDEVQRAMSTFSYFESLDEETLGSEKLGSKKFVNNLLEQQRYVLLSNKIRKIKFTLRNMNTANQPNPIRECQLLQICGIVSRREGCIMAKMKSFEENEVIVGDGVNTLNYVYFILTGKCQMIETLKIIETKRQSRTFYTLYDPYVPIVEPHMDIEAKYFANYNKKPIEKKVSTADVLSKIFQNIEDMEEGSDSDFLLKSAISSPPSVRLSLVEDDKQKPHIKNMRIYFMQVCCFNPGSTFGFDEDMRDRRIIALTPVTCMLMPMAWLLSKNTANIWTRIQHYLENKVPSKAKVFEEFLKAKNWACFQEQIITDVISRNKRFHCTSLHDVPYSIRMEELIN